jgi:hypothetical protein
MIKIGKILQIICRWLGNPAKLKIYKLSYSYATSYMYPISSIYINIKFTIDWKPK